MGSRIITAAVFVSWVLIAWALAGSDARAEMASYEASYGVSGSRSSGSGLSPDVSGAMTVRVESTCEGWLFGSRWFLSLRMDGKTVLSVEESQSVQEAFDGSATAFVSHQVANDTVTDVRGQARKHVDGGAGEIRFSKPEAKRIPLPEGTLFGQEHTAFLIEQGRSGVRQESRFVVVPGRPGAPLQAVSFLLGAANPPDPKLGPLAAVPGWRFRIAFFEPDSGASQPAMELEMDILENGITQTLTMDIGGLLVTYNLLKLVPLAAERGC